MVPFLKLYLAQAPISQPWEKMLTGDYWLNGLANEAPRGVVTLAAGLLVAEVARRMGLLGQKRWDHNKAKFEVLKQTQLERIASLRTLYKTWKKARDLLEEITTDYRANGPESPGRHKLVTELRAVIAGLSEQIEHCDRLPLYEGDSFAEISGAAAPYLEDILSAERDAYTPEGEAESAYTTISLSHFMDFLAYCINEEQRLLWAGLRSQAVIFRELPTQYLPSEDRYSKYIRLPKITPGRGVKGGWQLLLLSGRLPPKMHARRALLRDIVLKLVAVPSVIGLIFIGCGTPVGVVVAVYIFVAILVGNTIATNYKNDWHPPSKIALLEVMKSGSAPPGLNAKLLSATSDLAAVLVSLHTTVARACNLRHEAGNLHLTILAACPGESGEVGLVQSVPYIGGGVEPLWSSVQSVKVGVAGRAYRTSEPTYLHLGRERKLRDFRADLVSQWGYSKDEASAAFSETKSTAAIPLFLHHDMPPMGILFLRSSEFDAFQSESARAAILLAASGIESFINRRYDP